MPLVLFGSAAGSVVLEFFLPGSVLEEDTGTEEAVLVMFKREAWLKLTESRPLVLELEVNVAVGVDEDVEVDVDGDEDDEVPAFKLGVWLEVVLEVLDEVEVPVVAFELWLLVLGVLLDVDFDEDWEDVELLLDVLLELLEEDVALDDDEEDEDEPPVLLPPEELDELLDLLLLLLDELPADETDDTIRSPQILYMRSLIE